MPTVSVRMNDELYRNLRQRAYRSDLSLSAFVRPAIESAVAPDGKRTVTAHDELLGVMIQTFALLSALAAEHPSDVCRKGLEQARKLLAERGLLDEATL